MDGVPSKAQRIVAMPYNRAAGFVFVSRDVGHAEVTLEPREQDLQVDGVVHGGVIAGLADTAAVYAIYPDLGDGRSVTSIEFKVNFLRPARIECGFLRARARALKVGRSVATCEVDVSQGEEHVARGLFTYLVMDTDRV